ncbi:protein transport protein SEC31 [Nematocida homosporus]|uniref:protein transport protein SEC31 n=1 Tax=Nematocida homosporus TaxID=1912981 RepID=UPI00221F6D4E|nr:protein transport protein SEC31 [Nematocida homosporus]KAI5185137.1 protein transport protein SEC31 [Nematocida homosporus]
MRTTETTSTQVDRTGLRVETTSIPSFSQKGSMLALGTKSKILDANFSPGSKLQIMSLETEEVLFRKEVPARFNRLDWGCYGDKLFLAGGLDGGNLSLWDTTGLLGDGEPKELTFTNCAKTEDDILGIDFALGMPVLATGSSGGKIVLWNLRTLDKPLSPGNTTKYDGISCIQWNKKIPQVLAVGTTDGVVSVLDLRGKSEVSRLAGPYFSRSEITTLQWDPSSSTQLAVSSSSSECQDVVIYDLRVTKGAPRLQGHTDGILKTTWSEHDPSLIVTCGCDGSIVAWNAKTLSKRGVILQETAFDFVFSPEHPDTVAYATFNGEVVVDSLTSLNAKSPFLDSVPLWQQQGAALSFSAFGLLVYQQGLKLRPWHVLADKSSYEWQILAALEKGESLRQEMLKILGPAEETSPELVGELVGSPVKIDHQDLTTEKILRGDLSGAFQAALKESAPLAALVALCHGPEMLAKHKLQILRAPGASSSLLVLLSVLTGQYEDLVEQDVDWTVLVKILARHCSDSEFISRVHKIAEVLDAKSSAGANICYLLAEDVQKYQAFEEARVKLPRSLSEASEFYQDFHQVFAITEKAVSLLNQSITITKPTIAYLKHLVDMGEKERVLKFLGHLTPEAAVQAKTELGDLQPAAPLQPNRTRSTDMPRNDMQRTVDALARTSISRPTPPQPNQPNHPNQPAFNQPKPPTASPFAKPPMSTPSTPFNTATPPPRRPPMPTNIPPTMQPPQHPHSMQPPAHPNPFAPPQQHSHSMQPPSTGHSMQPPQQHSHSMPPRSTPKVSFVKTQPPANTLGSSLSNSAVSTPGSVSRPPPMPTPPHHIPSSNHMSSSNVSSGHLPYGSSSANNTPLRPPMPTPSSYSAQSSAGVSRSGSPPPPFPGAPSRPSVSMPIPPKTGYNPAAAFGAPTPQMGQIPRGPANGMPTGYTPNQPGYNHNYAPTPPVELNLTPEQEAVYQRLAALIDGLIQIINEKKSSLKHWLLKTINPKVEVLRKQIAAKRWSVDFLQKMDLFIKHIEDLGIHNGQNQVVSAEALDAVKKEGDAIVASRPVGTEIETWISAIYSLLKVALH